jgi:hypothetical protein
MKTKKLQKKIKKSVHQHVEQLFRHRVAVSLVLMAMGLSVIIFDTHVRNLVREANAQGWGCLGTYTRHEHPQHFDPMLTLAKIPTTSTR